MNAPKVSVLIATYNYSSVLRYAVASALRQSFTDFELIVIGDCCTDDSEAVARSFGDARVRWLNLPENSGSKSLPLNAGLKMARADYIAYLAHDDLWHIDHLKILVNAIERSGADFVYSVALYIPPEGASERPVSGVFLGEFRSGHDLVHSSVIHRKAVIDVIGDWPDYRKTQIPSDHQFWIRAADAGFRFIGVPKVTVWKFNASSRPGCYIDKRSDKQARYFQMLEEDPDRGEKDLINALRSAMIHGIQPLRTAKVGRDAAPGGHIQRLRQIRGLEPPEPMEMLPPTVDGNAFQIELPETMPRTIDVGRMLEFEVRIENLSDFKLCSNDPYPVHFAYHWLNTDGSIVTYEGERSQLVPPLPARASRYYYVRIRVPDAPGSYLLQPGLVQEKLRWLEGGEGGLYPVEVRPLPSLGGLS